MNIERYAIIGDIHANWDALEAVLAHAEARKVTSYVCVGDIVGYNADPVKCLEKIQELKCIVVKGNHDHYCSNDSSLHDFHPDAGQVVAWTREQLSDEQTKYLRNLPMVERFAGVTVVHSTLDMPGRWGYVFDPLEADAHFSYQTTPCCVYGHTHVPIVFERQSQIERHSFSRVKVTLGRRYLINVGSVGQPRDRDPRAAYTIYEPGTRTFELCRVEYDIARTQARIREAHLPDRLAQRLSLGK
ncbi:MAG: metallophosphoesterase family protein [Verrucomicrobia bacterium]|nr:metallophosphoesterase family protein [Verrucomicrobiota bacterium]